MAWRDIDTETETTASILRAALVSEGHSVLISKQTGSSIIAHNGATPLKQRETVTVVEFRALTQAAAEKLVELAVDNTSSVVYYAKRASGGTSQTYIAAAAKSGTVVNVNAIRHNESGGWTVRETTTQYSAEGTGWSDTKPSTATTGIVVSKTKSSIYTQYEGGVKKQDVTTTVTEYQFLTKAEAESLCTSSNSMTTYRPSYAATRQVYNSSNNTWVSQSYIGYYTYMAGTIKTSVMRYIDEANGWSVTQTEVVTGV